MENGDSAHSEHTHRCSNNAGHDFVYGTRSLCTLREEPEEKFPSALFIPYPYDYDRHCHKVGQVKALRLQCKAKYEVGFLR